MDTPWEGVAGRGGARMGTVGWVVVTGNSACGSPEANETPCEEAARVERCRSTSYTVPRMRGFAQCPPDWMGGPGVNLKEVQFQLRMEVETLLRLATPFSKTSEVESPPSHHMPNFPELARWELPGGPGLENPRESMEFRVSCRMAACGQGDGVDPGLCPISEHCAYTGPRPLVTCR
jgi:hypothetical protein